MRSLLPMGLVAVGCGGGPPDWDKAKRGSDRKQADPVTVVEVVEVGLGEVADVLTASAVIESEQMADLVPATSGVVVSLHRDEGDTVRRGDLLAVLDNVSLDANSQRSNAEVRRLTEQVEQLQALKARGAVSDRELADIEYQLETARLSANEASRSHGQTRLTAPFDGVVSSRAVRVGEYAGNGSAAFQIVDLDALRVVTSLPERDLPRVDIGQPARLISAYHDDTWAAGEVTRIAPVIDTNSGTFRVTIDIDDQEVLRPGQFVAVELEVDRHRDVVVVPKRALAWEDGAPVVYVQADAPAEEAEDASDDDESSRGDGLFASLFGGWGTDEEPSAEDADAEEAELSPWIAKRTSVELGLVDDDWAEVLDGVEIGDHVVSVGHNHLRDGARIKPVEPQEELETADASDTDGGDKG